MAEAKSMTKKPNRWRQVLITFAILIPYMIPLFWMWDSAGYPDSFGVQITAHGRAGVYEDWWYSYLLLGRPNALDVIIFCYMWAPIVGAIGWVVYRSLRHRGMKLRIFDADDLPEDSSS